MKLYRIWRTTATDYDQYDSAIVAAESEEEARKTDIGSTGEYGTWVTPDKIDVECIGIARPDMKAGLILASFNAG